VHRPAECLLSHGSLAVAKVADATPSDSGLASGLVNTSLQVGGAIGLAVLATLSTTRTDGLLADGVSSSSALTSGYHLAFFIGAALLVAAIGFALTVLEPVQVVEQEEMAELAEVEPAYSEAA
jgi:hypothetical protein